MSSTKIFLLSYLGSMRYEVTFPIVAIVVLANDFMCAIKPITINHTFSFSHF